ncbi:hypothetical protein SAMN04515671_2992 [Nakamurella panacisegetis]|uniref:Uncharacterized protein n=1 Tax=Nakamurella panacisegetis TaxID=1090615 RepID=A0A1H0Q4W2_9ACTN|nr:hypothetical protein SAMN04515671_2992 [Nakamurella panacisegetis]
MPGLAPGLLAAVPELASACARAVATLADADHVLLLTSGPRHRDGDGNSGRSTVVFPPGSPVTSAPLGDSQGRPHFDGHLNGPVLAAGPLPGVGVIVGAALLAAAGVDVPTTAVQVGTDPLAVYPWPGGPVGRVGVLLVADGSTSRGAGSPGGGHPDAASFDHDLAAALALGDPDRLGQVAGSGRGSAVGFDSGPAIAAFTRLTAGSGPASADLLYDGAPFGVGYFCATWSWR